MQLPPLQDILPRGMARMLGWALFFIPFSFYSLAGSGDQFPERPPALDVGIVTVAAILGGLVLNAGLALNTPKKKEILQVAQKFIAVVVLMTISLPPLHFIDLLMGGINVDAFIFDSSEAWLRGLLFWIAAIAFCIGISLFIIALVDLVYAMIGIGDAEKDAPTEDDNEKGRQDESRRTTIQAEGPDSDSP